MIVNQQPQTYPNEDIEWSARCFKATENSEISAGNAILGTTKSGKMVHKLPKLEVLLTPFQR